MSNVISEETLQAAQRRPHGAYTAELAQFAAGFSYQQAPADVRRFTQGIVLDTLGATLAASSGRYGLRGTLGKVVAQQGGTPEATLVGLGQKSSMTQAALYNGTLAYYCDIEAHHSGARSGRITPSNASTRKSSAGLMSSASSPTQPPSSGSSAQS